MLAEVDGSYFDFRGFGRDPWNVDVAYDMSAFLEQVGELARAMRSEDFASVDLYSQGVESALEFEPRAELVAIRCTSRTAWTPDPTVEVISRLVLVEMLERLVKQVARGLELIQPELIGQAPFDAWAIGEL